MSEYKRLVIGPPSEISKISDLFKALKAGIDVILNVSKTSVEFAKLQASGANLALMALVASLDAIILEIEKLKGGTFSGIISTPYSYRVKAGYDRNTDTMTLTAISALEQVQEAFDDEGDLLAPDKFSNYGGIIIVGATPDITKFYEILKSVGKFFSQQELTDLADQIKERFEEEEKPTIKLSTGLDFFGTSMAQLFPAYVALLNKVQSFVEGVKSGIISASKSLDDMIEFIEKKLAEAEEIAQDINDFMDQFIFELSEAGIYYKTFSGQKADDIKDELTKGTPASWKTSKYTLLFGLFGGAGSVELIFELLSLE